MTKKKDPISNSCPLPLELLNYIIRSCKKHFELYNFVETLTPFTSTISRGARTFEIGPVVENNQTSYQISLALPGEGTPLHIIELIAMLDHLFNTKLHLNNYALLINHESCKEYGVLDLMGITSTWNPQLSDKIFEFKSFFNAEPQCFCYGTLLSSENNNIIATVDLNHLVEIAAPYQAQYPLSQKQPLYAVAPLGTAQHTLAMLIWDHLAAHDLCVQIIFEKTKEEQLSAAQKLCASYCVCISEQDQQDNTVEIIHTLTGTHNRIAQHELVNFLGKNNKKEGPKP